MSSIIYKEVDIYGSRVLKDRVAQLVASELGGQRSPEEILRTINFSSGTTKVVGGFVDEELVSMNAFMHTRFVHNGTDVIGYQSGFSATDKNHRGKGYWPKLLLWTEDYLQNIGASFIYGFPNPTSHPLFVKKLNYSESALYNLRIPVLPILFDRAFVTSAAHAESNRDHLDPDFEETLAWKRQTPGDRILDFGYGGSFVWGRVRKARKLGVPIDFLEIGTFHLENPQDLKPMLTGAAKSAGVRFIYLSMTTGNQHYRRLKFRQSRQPVIFKGVGGFDPLSANINVFGGLRDTF